MGERCRRLFLQCCPGTKALSLFVLGTLGLAFKLTSVPSW